MTTLEMLTFANLRLFRPARITSVFLSISLGSGRLET